MAMDKATSSTSMIASKLFYAYLVSLFHECLDIDDLIWLIGADIV